jgi:hypothetical protein
MRKFAFVALSAVSLGLALTACAPRYYDDRTGYDGPRDHYRHYDRDGYYDRDGVPNRYDRDSDGVPNYADRRPDNPYRN